MAKVECLDQLITRKRFALWWWLHHKMGWRKTEISRIFNLDHSTVVRGVDRARDYPEDIASFELAQCRGKLFELLTKE